MAATIGVCLLMQSTFSQAMERSRRSSAAEKAMGDNWLGEDFIDCHW
jgi:hypothetical protein